MIEGLINIVVLLLVLTGLVLLHELGHFVAARRAGVTVHEFGIGFPPRARVLFRRGDTTYTLNWLPIGGFVRMEGEEVSPADGSESDEEREAREERESQPERESLDPRAFVNQPLGTRLAILFAGVAVNFVVAWFIFSLIAFTAEPIWRVRIEDPQPGSPAAAAGLQGGEFVRYGLRTVVDAEGEPTGEVERVSLFDDSGDAIIAIDGATFPVFDEMARPEEAAQGRLGPIQYLRDRAGETVTLTVERTDGTVAEVEATLRSTDAVARDQGALGIQWRPEYAQQQNGLLESALIGVRMTIDTSTLILRAVGGIVVGIFSGSGDGIRDVAGPVGMVNVIGDVRTGLPPVFLLWFVGLISANLGVINLLPIPPLDGSRMVMGIVQAASGNRVSPATERLVYFTGWVALMIFLVIVTFNDIGRLIE